MFLSVKSIVIAPAKTGRDSRSKIDVIKTVQINRGSLSIDTPRPRILIMVVKKFIAPAIDPAPAKCKLNIARSTDKPLCETLSDNGGYTVHPVPTPLSTKLELSNNIKEKGNIQKLKLFKRGKAMSGAPISKGTNQLP